MRNMRNMNYFQSFEMLILYGLKDTLDVRCLDVNTLWHGSVTQMVLSEQATGIRK